MANPQPTTPEWLMLGGAAATLIGSFLDVGVGVSAWSNTFSTIKLVPIYAIAVGGVVALARLLRVEMPDALGPFTWSQVLVVVSGFATVMAVSWLLAIDNRAAGIYVVTAGSVVMLVGALADQRAAGRRRHLSVAAPTYAAREHMTTPNIVILGAGAAMLLGSFLPFWKFSGGGLFPDVTITAWNRDSWFPVTIIPVGCAAVMVTYIVVRIGFNLPLPARVGGFTWDQVLLACGFQAAVMMLAWVIENQPGAQRGAGFYLMLVASIALAVGAVLRTREVRRAY